MEQVLLGGLGFCHMNNQVGYIFPGQGSQYPGMGVDFCNNFPSARLLVERAEDILERPLLRLLYEGSDQELQKTENAQVTIFLVSAMIWQILCEELALKPQGGAFAGMSLGEYTALFAAEVLSFEDALTLVQLRAQMMQKICYKNPGGMVSVIGRDFTYLYSLVKNFSEIWIANINTARQIVVAGGKEQLKQFCLQAQKSYKTIHLNVDGAFHTPYMQEANDQLQVYISMAPFMQEGSPVIMNSTGKSHSSIKSLKKHLQEQMVSPVLWKESIEQMWTLGITSFWEIGPGAFLTRMNKQIVPNSTTYSIASVEDFLTLQKSGSLCC